jgi:tetratricopeptide (TPR) repeat protein
MDEWDKAEQEYQKLLLEKKESSAYGYGLGRMQALYLIQGRFNDYQECVREALELSENISQPSWVVTCHMWSAYGERRTGRWDQALKELDSAWQIAEDEEYLASQRSILSGRSQIYLEMNRLEEAQKTAAELKKRIDQAPAKDLAHIHYYVMGLIELKKENFQKAIQSIRKAVSLIAATSSSNLLYGHSLGKAYYLAGDLENAAREFEKAAALTTGKLSYGDVYVRSYFMLGRVYQEMGQMDKAIKNYEKFLEFWKDVDPGLSEVQEARARLQKLESI